MSLKYTSLVWKHSTQAGTHKLVLLALAEFADENGECWPARSTLAEMTGVTDRHIKRILRDIEADGELRTERQRGRSNTNRYQILVSEKGTPESPFNEEKRGHQSPLLQRKRGHFEQEKGTCMSPDPLDPSINTDPADEPQPESKPKPADEGIASKPSSLVSAKEKAKEPEEPTADQAMFEAICHCVGWDYHIITNSQRGQVAQTKGILAKNGYTIEDLRKFWMYWRNEDWRGKQGQAPTLSQLRAEIGKVKQKQVPSVLASVAINGAAIASTFGESQR